MSALARRNGWRGFDGIGEKFDRGTEYRCEGAGFGADCEGTTFRTKPWTTVGKKRGGWVVLYGANDDSTDDHDVVLVLCPIHARPAAQPDAEGGGEG